MPYGLPELKQPDFVGSYAKGSDWREGKDARRAERDERARKQPIIEQLEKLSISKGEQAVKLGERSITLKDMAIKAQEEKKAEKDRKDELDDISKAATWVSKQPKESRSAAFKQVTDFYGSQGHDVSMFEGRDDLVPFLADINKPGGVEKFGRVFQGVDKGGDPAFYQASQTGGLKQVEGARPLSLEEKATGAGLKTGAQEGAKTKELVRREDVLKSSQVKLQKAQLDVLEKEWKQNQAVAKNEASTIEAQDSISLAEGLLSGDLESIYGVEEQLVWDRMRSQDSIDMMAKRDRLVALFELAAAGKMKGQGQVSEGERKILKDSATVLSNRKISADAAKAEIERGLVSLRASVKGLKAPVSSVDQQALEWANQNPNDPRSKLIREKAGQ